MSASRFDIESPNFAIEYGHELRSVAGTPWSTRMAAGSARPALEIYRGAALIDVVVARSFAPLVLRGARRVARHGLMYCVAWGCLPADGSDIRVEFRTGRFQRRGLSGRRTQSVPTSAFASRFWIATATGRFDWITVTSLDSRDRCAVRTLR